MNILKNFLKRFLSLCFKGGQNKGVLPPFLKAISIKNYGEENVSPLSHSQVADTVSAQDFLPLFSEVFYMRFNVVKQGAVVGISMFVSDAYDAKKAEIHFEYHILENSTMWIRSIETADQKFVAPTQDQLKAQVFGETVKAPNINKNVEN